MAKRSVHTNVYTLRHQRKHDQDLSKNNWFGYGMFMVCLVLCIGFSVLQTATIQQLAEDTSFLTEEIEAVKMEHEMNVLLFNSVSVTSA